MKLLNLLFQIIDLFQRHRDPEISRYRHHGRQFVVGLVGGVIFLLLAIHFQSADLSAFGTYGPAFSPLYDIVSNVFFALALGCVLLSSWGAYQAYLMERDWYGSD